MAYFVVSYDLIKGKDYERIIAELERLKGQKSLLSFWLLDLNNTAQEVCDHLKSFIDDDDRLFVVEFSKRPAYTRALQGTSAWISERF